MTITSYKPTTLQVYECARRSFERGIGKKAEQATIADIEKWLHSLRASGRPASTCRTYLSAMNHISGVKVMPRGLPLVSTEKLMLSPEQIKRLLFSLRGQDRLLFLATLLYGRSARVWAWGWVMENGLDLPIVILNVIKDYLKERGLAMVPLTPGAHVHWVGGLPLGAAVFCARNASKPITEQEANRRLKRYAKGAGIESNISMRIWLRAGQTLLKDHEGDIEAALESLGIAAKIPTSGPTSKHAGQAVKWAFDTHAGAAAKVDRDPRLHGIGRRSKRMARSN